MKPKLLIATCVCLSAGLFAATYGIGQHSKKDISYCALLKDGQITLTADGKQVYADVKLEKGIKITTDGTVIYPNGFKVILKNGECVDRDGNITEFSNTKNKKQDAKTKML
jgi:hypothetical protein